jgi:hypothetical protein
MTTSAPAQEIHRPQLGNLDVGAEADVAVFRVEKGQFAMLDSARARMNASQRLLCELTLRKGQVAWDLNGLGTTGLDLNLPVSKQFGDFYVHANLGYTWLPDLQHITHVAGSGIWRVAPMFNLLFEGLVNVDQSVTVSPGFRRGWNFGEKQLVIGAAIPITRADGRSTAALLTYFSYELPFR